MKEYADRLPELQLTMMRIALANYPPPELLVIGGIDDLASDAQRNIIYEQLAILGENQTIVVADENARSDIPGAKTIIELPHLATATKPTNKTPEPH